MIWFLVALCWIISFLLSGIEAGLLALNPVRLRHRAKSGDTGARRLQEKRRVAREEDATREAPTKGRRPSLLTTSTGKT